MALQDSLGGGKENKSISPPYTPELNGIAERVNRTMVEGSLAMLIQANLPSCLWPFALKHAIYVRNRVPHSATGSTPYSMFVGKKPSLKNLRVFGCAAYVLSVPDCAKFESRAIEGVYLESLEHGVYKVLVTDEDGIPKITKSRHVTFDESKFLPGAPKLEDYMENEVESGVCYNTESEDSESDSDYSESDCDSEVYLDTIGFPDSNADDSPSAQDPDPILDDDSDDDNDDDDVDNDEDPQAPKLLAMIILARKSEADDSKGQRKIKSSGKKVEFVGAVIMFGPETVLRTTIVPCSSNFEQSIHG